MEFRRQLVCRLAGPMRATTTTTSFFVPSTPNNNNCRRAFSTDPKLESAAGAAAVAPSPPQSQSQPPLLQSHHHRQSQNQKPAFNKPPSATHIRAETLRKHLDAHRAANPLPPRPAVISRSSFLSQPYPQQSNRVGGSGGGAANRQNTPNSSTSSATSLLANIKSDIEKSTSEAAAATQAKAGMSYFQMSDFLKKHQMHTTEMRLRPSTGRTVPIANSVDVARAFKILEGNCRQNNVKKDARDQKFHERPALKRKRQARERWRARFRQGFSATISRVMELRGQGW